MRIKSTREVNNLSQVRLLSAANCLQLVPGNNHIAAQRVQNYKPEHSPGNQTQRVCALVLCSYFLIVKTIDVVIELVNNHKIGSLGGLAIACLTGLLFLNGVRGTFAYHKFNETIINRKIIISKTISAFIYGVVIWLLSMAVLKLIQSHPSEDAFALASIPADIIIWVSYLGWLPFTKGSVMMPNPKSVHS